MSDAHVSKLLRTTTVQAFARTMPSDSGGLGGDPGRPHDARRTQLGADTRAGAPEAGRRAQDEGARDERRPERGAVALPEVGDVVGGQYRLIRLLGEGMFGKVYVAQRLDVPEHQVALKLMPGSLYVGRNVERELVMLATVGHPHVVQLKDHGTTPAYVWLTMPVYQGETLAERLEKRGPLTPRQAYDIFVPVARGLEALHAAGLRHQDVKPENIFLAVFGGRLHPVLLDLGVAAEKDAAFVAGTALYGSPEQLAALSGLPTGMGLSEKMDTYGLAATLLMALVGPKYFPGEQAKSRSELAEAQDVRTTEPIASAALPDVTGDPRDQLEACFRQWLAFSPDDRPTMKELAEALEVLLEPDAEEERRERARSERQARTILWFKIAIAGMLVLGVAGGALAYNQRQTLHIASELERAERDGAKRFSELGACNAAHAADTTELRECRAGWDKTREDYRRELDDVTRSGSSTQAESARQAQRYLARIKSCDEAATQQRRTCEEEAATAAGEAARDKGALSAQRDEARDRLQATENTLASREVERDACRADRERLTEERDALRTALAARPVARPASSPSSTPGRSTSPPPSPSSSEPVPAPSASPTTQTRTPPADPTEL